MIYIHIHPNISFNCDNTKNMNCYDEMANFHTDR